MSEKLKKIKNEIAAFLTKSDNKGNTLLHYVVKSDDVEFAEKLIVAGCDVNMKNDFGDPPIAYAIRENQLEMVKLLLNKGAQYDNEHFACKTGPLHIAVEFCYPDIVQLLIAVGADVDARDVLQKTALHCLVHYTHKADDCYAILKSLIDAGADVNARENDGWTPLLNAIMQEFDKGIDLLLSKGAVIRHEEDNNFHYLHQLLELGHGDEVVGQLIKLGADVNELDERGNSCLSVAVSEAKHEVVELLLNNGARIDSVNNEGFDPLCNGLITWRSHYENFNSTNDDHDNDIEDRNREFYFRHSLCLNLLIERGANVNYVTNNGWSPLDIVLLNYDCFHSNFVSTLLKNGAKLDFNNPFVQEVLDNSNGSKFPHLLFRHAAMYEARNLSDGSVNFDLNKLNEKSRQDYIRCQSELNLMKATKINDTNVTFFNVLVAKDIGSYMRNELITSAFETTDDILKCFPIYGDSMCKRFSKELKFQKLVEEATNSLAYALKWDRDSTHIILSNIIRYLDKKDLTNLACIDKNVFYILNLSLFDFVI